MQAFAGRATLASTITDIAIDADVVGVCVQNDAQVNDCVAALIPAMKPGSVLMIHSTVSPDTVKAAGALGAAAGIAVIDAPVTVTEYDVYREDPAGVTPFVLVMVGGGDDAVARVKPLLDAVGTETVRCNELGSAMGLKVINNLVTLVGTIVAEEAFRLAAMSGVPAGALQTVMTRNGVLTKSMATITGRIGESAPDDVEQRIRVAQAANGVKDLAMAEELAKGALTSSATATFAKSQYWFSMTSRGLPSA
jgi:3-hydroxyisobutyrate dehydrogenase-like beta-hydroxyacid dehydrogenase